MIGSCNGKTCVKRWCVIGYGNPNGGVDKLRKGDALNDYRDDPRR